MENESYGQLCQWTHTEFEGKELMFKVAGDEVNRFMSIFTVTNTGALCLKSHLKHINPQNEPRGRKETDTMTLDEMIQKREEAMKEYSALPVYTPPEMVDGKPVYKCKKCGAVVPHEVHYCNIFHASNGSCTDALYMHLKCPHCGYDSKERLAP